MQCPNSIANKNTKFTSMNEARRRCDGNPGCFAIYDVQCMGKEYYICENKPKWTEMTIYAKESTSSCLHFRYRGSFIFLQ